MDAMNNEIEQTMVLGNESSFEGKLIVDIVSFLE